MSVDFYRESPGKSDSRTLNRTTFSRWTGRNRPSATPKRHSGKTGSGQMKMGETDRGNI